MSNWPKWTEERKKACRDSITQVRREKARALQLSLLERGLFKGRRFTSESARAYWNRVHSGEVVKPAMFSRIFSKLVPRLGSSVLAWLLSRIVQYDPKRLSETAILSGRKRALAAYYANRETTNERRRLCSTIENLRKGRFCEREHNVQKEAFQSLVYAGEKVVMRYRRKSAQIVRGKLIKLLRRRLENSMFALKRGQSKSKTARELLGCDLEELRAHLEKQFRDGMTWENHGFKGWHVDHIQPLAAFDLSDLDQQRKAFHYSNLQPLWWKENFDKGTKLQVVAASGLV